jgi:hypothetical protein
VGNERSPGRPTGKPGDAKKGLLELDDPAPSQRSASEPAPSGTVARPTVRPSFDPRQYAEDSEIRERMPTFTDETALEQARLQSLPSNMPPARRPMSTIPGAIVAHNPRDSSVEIDTGEADVEALGVDEQVAILSAGLAPLSRVPVLAKEMKQLGPLLEDPKAAYVLGFVDGILPLETIIEVTGLPELDTLRVLDRMVGQGVVVFRPRT